MYPGPESQANRNVGDCIMFRSFHSVWQGSSRTSARVPALALGAALLLAACDRPLPTEATPGDLLRTLSGAKTVIVGFHSAPTAMDIAAVQSAGAEVIHQYKYIHAVAARVGEGGEVTLAALPGVRYVEDDIEMEPLAGKQVTDWGVRKIEAPAAWALGYRGQGCLLYTSPSPRD